MGERERLAAVRALGAADLAPSAELLALTRVAAHVAGAAVAAVRVVDHERVHEIAVTGAEPRHMARVDVHCTWVVDHAVPAYTADAWTDPRFAESPYVDGRLTSLRTYAGEPLLDPQGHVLGTLCVLDDRPVELDEGQRRCLADLAVQAAGLLRAAPGLDLLDDRLEAARAAQSPKALTGLPDAAAGRRALRQACARSGGALVVVDLDDLRAINDLAGRRAGDAALCATGGRLAGAMRPSDVVARLGGDEFGVLLPRVATADDLATVSTRLRAAVQAPVVLPDGTTLLPSVSVGAVLFERGADPDAVLQRAGTALRGDKQRVAAAVPAARTAPVPV